jgi:hypothetical protein
MAEPDFDWRREPREIPMAELFKFRLNFRTSVELAMSMSTHYYKIHDIYLRVIADNRGSRVLVALRRYKDKTGQWPERLEDIKTSAPVEIFIDPLSNDSFVYKLTEENFTLYSKGKNNIDENGERREPADDWLIWPRKGGKTKKGNSDAEKQ